MIPVIVIIRIGIELIHILIPCIGIKKGAENEEKYGGVKFTVSR